MLPIVRLITLIITVIFILVVKLREDCADLNGGISQALESIAQVVVLYLLHTFNTDRTQPAKRPQQEHSKYKDDKTQS